MRPNKDGEPIQEKWVPVFRPNGRPNKDLERFRDSVKFGNALELDTGISGNTHNVLRDTESRRSNENGCVAIKYRNWLWMYPTS